ncbi:MAG: TRAP transporter large permease [Phyllobacteriaceae bacterium]|nr:TRAP transporter large permease [Phyllobacteriaceae bacterium]
MDNLTLGTVGFVAVLVLILLEVPIGVSMGLIGIAGAIMIIGMDGALSIGASTVWQSLTNYTISVLPLFILMGNLASAAGISSRLYASMRALIGHRSGGLALATVGASAGFGMLSGSSLATAATISRIAVPEMKAANYPMSLSAASVAAGGTLGILIPPSTILVIYAFLTDQSIKDMMLAALIPAAIGVVTYALAVILAVKLGYENTPKVERATGAERLAALKDLLPTLSIFGLIMGGLYTGVFTANEAAAVGVGIVFIYGVVTRQLNFAGILTAARDTARTSGALYLVLIGAGIFNFFLTLTGLPFTLTSMLAPFVENPLMLILLLVVVYLILGAVMDSLAMLLLTVPLFAPIILAAGIDPIWFGIFVVVMVEIGLITPPVGMNLFVVRATNPEVPLLQIWKGVVPFLMAEIVRVVLLIAIPATAVWLLYAVLGR